MKTKHVFFSVLLIFSLNSFSQTAPAPYEVGIWSGFRAAAINYTFDDGCPNQFSVAIPLFDEFGFNLTLFTVTNWVSNWPALVSASANGHEVASHTASHPNFRDITLEQQEAELKSSKDTIENHIPDKSCITMAYPYCVPGADSVCSKYYISARGCQSFIEPKTPGSYLNVSSVVGGNLGAIKTLNDFKLNFENAAKINGWCVFLFHGIDNDGGYSPIASTELRKSVEYLSLRKSKFWVTTFANASLYSKERNAVTVTETLATDSSMTLEITDTLPDKIYNYPLTLRCPLPENWPSANVTQDSVAVPVRIVLVDTIVYITFDVVPDAGEVKLTRNLIPVTPDIDTIPQDEDDEPESARQPEVNNADVEALYSHGTLIVSLTDYKISDLLVCLYDTRGAMMLSQKLNFSGERNMSVDLESKALLAGVYFVYLSDGKNTWSKKIIVT